MAFLDPQQMQGLSAPFPQSGVAQQMQLPQGGMAPGMQPQMPQQGGFAQPDMSPQPGGMFGAGNIAPWKAALAAGLAGFVARRNPETYQGVMGMMQARQQHQAQMQQLQFQQNAEMQRQLAVAKATAQLRLMYPDSDFAQQLFQSGLHPGTPEWTQAMQTRTNNELDPAVLTPQGMMLRSQITAAMQPPSAPVGKLTPIDDGGPTQPASGGFPDPLAPQ